MKFSRACVESLGYVLPPIVVHSDEIERRLQPLYDRLRLPEGRLELISGVRERRVWAGGTLPSDMSALSGRLALEAAEWPPDRVSTLIHASVCRDHLEPATACRVHSLLGLPTDCLVYDVSNACLGIMNGILQVASMIELGQIEAGLVVGTESSGPLLEATLAELNSNFKLTRRTVKSSLASLTIGSASVAVLVVDEQSGKTGNRLIGAAASANTKHHELCRSGRDDAIGSGMQPLMQTDSEALLREGIAAGRGTFERFLRETGWNRADIDKSICHQVGKTHRALMLDALQLPPENDFATVETLGNTGSAALPVSWALAAREKFLSPGNRLALLGIGSGINCLMLGVHWMVSRVLGREA
jgi:3-oxoacyl-[acyl-carrier-protein] synthase-3